MPLGMELGLGPGDFVLDGNPSPPPAPKGGEAPKFSAHVYCGQTAACIKMVLDIVVGLSFGDFAFDRDPAPSPKGGGAEPISAHVYCGQTAAWFKMPLGTEVGLGLRDIVLDGDPAPPPLKGHSPPIFGQCPLWPNGWMN